jgi:D-beta-D-heptose 7-phosphate kinase/D-beta-D-heptose 1-phosphate adenosyltransferase
VVLSDYGKGVLTHRVLSGVISMARRASKPVIVDRRSQGGGDYSRYCGATVLTPNVAELSQALGRPVRNDEKALNAAAASLGEVIGCECMLVTRGERGMLIVARDGESASFEATAKRVVDVSGAGDTVVASFALALVSGAGFQNSARLANVAAGIAVSKKGTSQVSANELRDVLLFRPHFALQEKIYRFEAVKGQIAAWRQNGYSIGFTNGCFDLLHPGHVQMLSVVLRQAGCRAQ